MTAPTRRWFRFAFSLRTLFVAVTLASLACVVAPSVLQIDYRHLWESSLARKQRLWQEKYQRRPNNPKPFSAPEVESPRPARSVSASKYSMRELTDLVWD